MKTLHIINPKAGAGDYKNVSSKLPKTEDEIYTAGYYAEAYEKFPFLRAGELTEVYAFGGDGTVNRVVSDIMMCGTNENTILCPVPTGSGNDFYKTIHEKCEKVSVIECDVIKITGLGNDIYGINEVNIGFDCGVVANAAKYKRKPFVSGQLSYILGIAEEFFRKKTTELKLSITTDDGDEAHDGRYLLMCIANGIYYGGGFAAAPLSHLDDGYFDVVVVDDISRMKFVALVGDYKKGAHMDSASGAVKSEFQNLMRYFRARCVTLSGADRICVDGEIYSAVGRRMTIENIKRALRVRDALGGR
ncbi:MAG: hypothetical protein LUH54_04255 [Firmicutes bacterium]|nr:hypothetical protein [Bacillota bacterium]